MVSNKKMPPRRQQILEFVQEFYSQNGIPPTVRDIQKACQISSTSVVDYNLENPSGLSVVIDLYAVAIVDTIVQSTSWGATAAYRPPPHAHWAG